MFLKINIQPTRLMWRKPDLKWGANLLMSRMVKSWKEPKIIHPIKYCRSKPDTRIQPRSTPSNRHIPSKMYRHSHSNAPSCHMPEQVNFIYRCGSVHGAKPPQLQKKIESNTDGKKEHHEPFGWKSCESSRGKTRVHRRAYAPLFEGLGLKQPVVLGGSLLGPPLHRLGEGMHTKDHIQAKTGRHKIWRERVFIYFDAFFLLVYYEHIPLSADWQFHRNPGRCGRPDRFFCTWFRFTRSDP